MTILLLTRPQAPELFAAPLRDALPGIDVWESADEAIDERVEAIIAWKLKPGTCARYPNLKLLCATAAGVEKLTDDPSLPDDVAVMRIVDPMVNLGIAQYVAMMALRHVRALPLYSTQQCNRDWTRHRAIEPYTKSVCMLGLGEAGQACARLLHASGFNVIGWAGSVKYMQYVESFAGAGGLDRCLARADILVCTLPLTDATRGIIDAKLLAKLPRGGYVINVARGAHLVEADLVAAIDSGHIAGAALDVQEIEPLPADSTLWDHPAITVTPHIAAQASVTSIVQQFAANWKRRVQKMPLTNVVDRRRGY